MSLFASKKIIIAIDGTAGTGKSTVAKALAEKLNITYVNTGAMYRAGAVYISGLDPAEVISHDIEVDIWKGIIQKASEYLSQVRFIFEGDRVLVQQMGQDIATDITDMTREESIGKLASKIAKEAPIREALLQAQRNFAEQNSTILDGRDIGTVVFPNADIKIFFTATPEIRAERRYRELEAKEALGTLTLEQIYTDICQRDEQDQNRAIAPLRKADDAIEIDTSNMTQDEVISQVYQLIQDRLKA